MNSYSLHICKKSELNDLQQFINAHWRKDHILARSQSLMDWQHYNKENAKYNFVLAKHLESKEIHGVLGFIPITHFDKTIKEKDLWLAMWKVIEDNSAPGLGLSLLKYLINHEKPRSISVLGISPETIPLYKYLGFNTGVMNHYYIVNTNKKKFNLIKNYKKLDQPNQVKETRLNIFRFEKLNFLTLSKRSKFITSNQMIPKKTPEYIYKRYFCHPIYNYCVYGLEKNNDIVGIMVIRLASYSSSCALRLVDFIGDPSELFGLCNLLQNLLQEFNAEYIDFYNFGIREQILLSNGFLRKNSDSDVIIPNYFEPFESKNIDIEYAYKCKNGQYFNICKGDGDQDRPN